MQIQRNTANQIHCKSIDFMLKGKSFLDYTNLFSPNDYEKKW